MKFNRTNHKSTRGCPNKDCFKFIDQCAKLGTEHASLRRSLKIAEKA